MKGLREGELGRASPFFINREFTGLIGEPQKIKKTRDGSLLVQAASATQAAKLLEANTLGGKFVAKLTKASITRRD
jgi:hypothetical protein